MRVYVQIYCIRSGGFLSGGYYPENFEENVCRILIHGSLTYSK